jgi:hypothetical protein
MNDRNRGMRGIHDRWCRSDDAGLEEEHNNVRMINYTLSTILRPLPRLPPRLTLELSVTPVSFTREISIHTVRRDNHKQRIRTHP